MAERDFERELEKARVQAATRAETQQRYANVQYFDIVRKVLEFKVFEWPFVTKQEAVTFRHNFNSWKRARLVSPNPDSEAWQVANISVSLVFKNAMWTLVFKKKISDESMEFYKKAMAQLGENPEELVLPGTPPAGPVELAALADSGDAPASAGIPMLSTLDQVLANMAVEPRAPQEPQPGEEEFRKMSRAEQRTLEKLQLALNVWGEAVQGFPSEQDLEAGLDRLIKWFKEHPELFALVERLVKPVPNSKKREIRYMPKMDKQGHETALAEWKAAGKPHLTHHWALALAGVEATPPAEGAPTPPMAGEGEGI